MTPGIGHRCSAALLLTVVICLSVCGGGCERPGAGKPPPTRPAKPKTKPALAAPAVVYDDDYTAALGAADMFCQAWKTRDLYGGQALLSAGMKAKYTPERIRLMIMGRANPRHAAYEIFDGTRLDDGRLAFSLRLFHSYAGRHYSRVEAPLSRIVLARDDAGHWKVDEFPVP